jgi:hypothetical protein
MNNEANTNNIDITKESSFVVQVEEQCREEINTLITEYNCSIIGEINIIPPFPTQSKLYVVSNLRTDKSSPEIEQVEKLVEQKMIEICTRYSCVGLTKFKVAKGVAGCIPLFVHRTRLVGYVEM